MTKSEFETLQANIDKLRSRTSMDDHQGRFRKFYPYWADKSDPDDEEDDYENEDDREKESPAEYPNRIDGEELGLSAFRESWIEEETTRANQIRKIFGQLLSGKITPSSLNKNAIPLIEERLRFAKSVVEAQPEPPEASLEDFLKDVLFAQWESTGREAAVQERYLQSKKARAAETAAFFEDFPDHPFNPNRRDIEVEWSFQDFANHFGTHLQSMIKAMRDAGIVDKSNKPTPEWEKHQRTRTLRTRFGDRTQYLWDAYKVLDALGEKTPEPTNGRSAGKRPTLRPFNPRDIPNGNDQAECLLHFLKIGPTRGGKGFEHAFEEMGKYELFHWTDDPDSDIPFFYIRFKSETATEAEEALEEKELLIEAAEYEEKVCIDPAGSSIACIIVPVKHDRAIHWNGGAPSEAAEKKLRELCQNHGIRMALSFGGTSCSMLEMPWDE